jgi:hypothetical protein
MKIITYTSTPGLDRYPERERFAVYRTTHKSLMREDVAYRRQWRSYVGGIVCVAIVPISGFVADRMIGILLSVLSIMVGLAGVAYLTFRQQRRMNQRIGDVLLHQVSKRALHRTPR